MRDQDPHGPDAPLPGDGREGESAPVTRGRFGESGAGPRDPAHSNGHRTAGAPVGRPFAEPDEDGPVDLVELQADDELINALSSGLSVSGPGRQGYDADDRLVAMLASWKAEIDDEPMPELVDTDEAVQMLQPAKPSRKVSFLRPLVAAAAVAACALAVVSIGAHEAQPGDALWGVTRVLYTEHAQQVQARSELRAGIERVNARLAVGDPAGAQRALAEFGPLVDRVGQEHQDYFSEQQRFLRAKAAEATPGTPINPQAPLKDGTPAPPPPASSEGRPTPPEPVAPRPESGSSSPSGTSGSTSPGGTSGSTSPGGSGSSSPSDPPQVLEGPGGSGSPSPTAPSDPPESSPSTEGSADPTTTTTPSPTQPTAAGEGSADPDRPTSPSSSSSGSVSSTPN
ncbi:anti-sigma-D factor RsdA [Pseudonocardia nantongensis]|uniref:anti-sigma-D factor RsdA n=1 Tax=Pseudonocardia nantongensis TaxID=1181885 RepID=UPI00397D6966